MTKATRSVEEMETVALRGCAATKTDGNDATTMGVQEGNSAECQYSTDDGQRQSKSSNHTTPIHQQLTRLLPSKAFEEGNC
ncbi:hypothetical protein ACLOJK_022492 [Asimina triloba]